MAFLDDAKEALGEKFDKLQLLARKSADFEATQDEENELAELKASVRTFVSQRDRAKNLEFIKTGGFSVAEVLRVMGATKEQVNKAVAELFPAQIGPILGTVKTKNESGKEVVEEIRSGKGLSREAMKELKANEKAFVKCLSADGKSHLLEQHISEAGPYKGQKIYTNIGPVITRFKLDKAKFLKELQAK